MSRFAKDYAANIILLVVSIFICLGALEAIARISDGRSIWGGSQYFGTPQDMPVERWIREIGSRPEHNGNLWRLSPPPLPNRREPTIEDKKRLQEFGGASAAIDLGPRQGQLTVAELFKVWNVLFARDVCRHYLLSHLVRWPLDLFEPPTANARPRFRFRPNASLPSGLVTNEIGWRGKPLRLRDDKTVRIVFVGASTIAEAHAIPWSAPELIEVWLNAWATEHGLDVTFEVLNAGREGSSTPDVVQIVRNEVVAMRPDLVVFYEGALQFDLSSVVSNSEAVKSMPPPDFVSTAGWAAKMARQSSLLAHVLSALSGMGWSVGSVAEAAKPTYDLMWPRGLDEMSPDLERKDLPANLSTIVHDLNEMRLALAAVDSELAVSSFSWLVYEGLRVDPVKGRYIWSTNNQIYWPWRYRDIRRIVDFENRVYAKFARSNGLSFLDVASLMPLEPSLFADGVHMTESGVRVKAWAFFKTVLPVIETRLRSRQWPRAKVPEQWPTFNVIRKVFDCRTRNKSLMRMS